MMPSLTFLSFLLCTTVASAETVVTLNATRDNYIDESYPDGNQGFTFFLNVGRVSSGLFRTLIAFDLNAAVVPSDGSQELVKATLILSLLNKSDDYIPCSSTNIITCATVHILTTAWGEGDGGLSKNATAGESSWRHSTFPTEWKTPGGDFQTDVLGTRTSEAANDNFAVFPLNVNLLQPLMDNPSLNQGFLLRNDGNPGAASFYSRNSFRADRPRPRLELEFAAASPTVTPTRNPTNAPASSPTGAPLTLAPTIPVTASPTTSSPTGAPSTTKPTAAPTPLMGESPTSGGSKINGGHGVWCASLAVGAAIAALCCQ